MYIYIYLCIYIYAICNINVPPSCDSNAPEGRTIHICAGTGVCVHTPFRLNPIASFGMARETAAMPPAIIISVKTPAVKPMSYSDVLVDFCSDGSKRSRA